MEDKAYAKINLALDVVSRREDGYHNLNTIMVPISLYDVLTIEKAEKMSFFSKGMVFDAKNTIVKAVLYMKKRFNISDNFKVTLVKNIPAQAGLGGGSSDGACAIRILNKMYSLNMSKEEIKKACMFVGADVLFTYYNIPSVVQGIGDILKPIVVKENKYVLIVKPKAGVSTKEAYQNLDIISCDHPDIKMIVDRIKEGFFYDHLLSNSLEEGALEMCPEIMEAKKELRDAGFDYPLMTGSGSCVFVLSDNLNNLMDLKDILKKKFEYVCVTNFLLPKKQK